MTGRFRDWLFEGDGPMAWRDVAVTTAAMAVPPLVAVSLYGRVGAVAFVAALPAHLAAKDSGIKVAVLVTLVMGMAGLLSLGQPGMALIVGTILGLMAGICGSWGLARPCIRALLTWTIFTSPIIAGADPTFLFLIFTLSMVWALAITWYFGHLRSTGQEESESEEYAFTFAIVMAVGMFVSVWVGSRFFGDHGFWFPLTFVVLCLPPHGHLFKRTAKRSLGTVIGTAIALLGAALTVTPWVMAGIGLAALPLGFRFLPYSYTIFTAFLTLAILEVLALVSNVNQLAFERVGTMAAAAAMTLGLAVLGWLALKLFRPEALNALQDEG